MEVLVNVTFAPWQMVVVDVLITTEGVHAEGGGPMMQMLKFVVTKPEEALNTRTKYVCPMVSKVNDADSLLPAPF